MKFGEIKYPETLEPILIAPCGMNCGICSGYLRDLREKNQCPGCNGNEVEIHRYCAVCTIRNCAELREGGKSFCFECARFPCLRLRQLDKRYRTRYGMSMLENLESIRALGLEGFVTREKARWKCPQCGGVICVHKKECVYCGRPRD